MTEGSECPMCLAASHVVGDPRTRDVDAMKPRALARQDLQQVVAEAPDVPQVDCREVAQAEVHEGGGGNLERGGCRQE